MKQELKEALIITLMPYLKDLSQNELGMRLDIALADYEVTKAQYDLAVYEGEVNDIILQRFLAAKIAKGLSPRTIKYYKESISMTLATIGKPYSDVTADDIRLYLAKRIFKDHVSKTTSNNERRNLSAFYTWLQREEILLKNPMNKVDSIKIDKKKRKAFDQMEIEKLRDKAQTKRESALLETLISTWARVSEVSMIRIDEIRGGKVLVHGKGAKDREVYLTPKAVLAINNYLAERKDDNPYLFPGMRGAREGLATVCKKAKSSKVLWYTDAELVDKELPISPSVIESIVRNIGKRAGVSNVHPHRFRRTGATTALRNGMPLINVSKLLGHENIGTTQIYLDISDEELEQMHKRYVV